MLQGFLFTAFVNRIGLYDKAARSPLGTECLTVGLVLIGVLGITLSIVVLNVVRIAFSQMEKVKAWWQQTGLSGNFPPVAGDLGKGWFYLLFSTGRMPFILIGAWCALVALLLLGVK